MIRTFFKALDDNLDFIKFKIDEEFFLLMKNINGIYAIVNDVTNEVYIGRSNNIGRRIQEHKNNNNFIVADLMKKPHTSIYIYMINDVDFYNKYSECLEMALIYCFSIYSKIDQKFKCVNIEFNIKHELYRQYVNERKITSHRKLMNFVTNIQIDETRKNGLLNTIKNYIDTKEGR